MNFAFHSRIMLTAQNVLHSRITLTVLDVLHSRITLTVQDDAEPENDETFEFVLRVTGPGSPPPADVSGVNGRAIVTIIANDDAGGVFG